MPHDVPAPWADIAIAALIVSVCVLMLVDRGRRNRTEK